MEAIQLHRLVNYLDAVLVVKKKKKNNQLRHYLLNVSYRAWRETKHRPTGKTRIKVKELRRKGKTIEGIVVFLRRVDLYQSVTALDLSFCACSVQHVISIVGQQKVHSSVLL